MKKHILVKAGHHMLIAAFGVGVLLPLAAAQAETEDTQRMQDERSGSAWSNEREREQRTNPLLGVEVSPPSNQYDSRTAQGAQGPIRSDMMGERFTGRDRLDIEKDKSYDPDPTGKLIFGGS